MEPNLIRTKKDYRLALSEVSALVELDPSPRSAQAKRLEVIVTAVQAYEQKHFPIEAPDHFESIKFRVEQAQCRSGWQNP